MDKVRELSLSFVSSVDTSILELDRLEKEIYKIVDPGEMLEHSTEFLKIIEKIDSRISIDKVRLQNLTQAYKMRLNDVRQIYTTYIHMVQECMESHNQIGIGDNFYDEENLLSKNHYKDLETDPSMYSTVEIISRIVTDEEENLDYIEILLNKMDNVYKTHIEALHNILILKKSLSDPSELKQFSSEEMSDEANKSIHEYLECIRRTRFNIGDSRIEIKRIFNSFNKQEVDYLIYEKAINSFQTSAIESTFSMGSVIEMY